MREAEVSVYHNGNWLTDVGFKWKWQAYLFHLLLNQSDEHAGVREY